MVRTGVVLVLLLSVGLVHSIVPFPTQYYPSPVSSTPRLWIKNDLPRLQTLWNSPSIIGTYVIISKLMPMLRLANQNHNANLDKPFSSLYADKAISVFIPYLNAQPHVNGRLQSITHYALAYDWLQGYSGFDSSVQSTMRTKFIAWSDAQFASDNTAYGQGQDSDHETAATVSHFVAGCAIYGHDDTNAIKLMNRGWTNWAVRINDIAGALSIEDMFEKTLSNGIPLPGWDYNWMSDMWDTQNMWWILDELGYTNPQLRVWWKNAIVTFIHNVDPKLTHYRWIGDTQSGVMLDVFTGQLWSWLSNCIFLAERYGYPTEAAWGRSFLDQIEPGYGEGDPLLLFARSYDSSALRIDGSTSVSNPLPRYIVGGVGPSERMGYGFFRSGWSASSTWGGFAGIGNYLVDHMHAIHGSFFIWRNGEYLTTDPHNYGGETRAELYNSLSIPNPREPDTGGPIWYYNQSPAVLERARILNPPVNSDLYYSMVNCDGSYNTAVFDPYHLGGRPVSSYRRHFLYDGADYAFTIDRVELVAANWTAWRYRNQNQQAPSSIGNNMYSIPSDKGTYRTLIKVLSPSSVTWSVFNELTGLAGVSGNTIDSTMRGYSIKAKAPNAVSHRWIVVMNFDSVASGNSQLDSAALISSSSNLIGAFAGNTVFVAANNEILLGASSFSYSTPASTSSYARHVISDITPGCYSVMGSIDGQIGSINVINSDNTLIFWSVSSGSQTFTVSGTTGCSLFVGPIPNPNGQSSSVTPSPSRSSSQSGGGNQQSTSQSQSKSSSTSVQLSSSASASRSASVSRSRTTTTNTQTTSSASASRSASVSRSNSSNGQGQSVSASRSASSSASASRSRTTSSNSQVSSSASASRTASVSRSRTTTTNTQATSSASGSSSVSRSNSSNGQTSSPSRSASHTNNVQGSNSSSKTSAASSSASQSRTPSPTQTAFNQASGSSSRSASRTSSSNARTSASNTPTNSSNPSRTSNTQSSSSSTKTTSQNSNQSATRTTSSNTGTSASKTPSATLKPAFEVPSSARSLRMQLTVECTNACDAPEMVLMRQQIAKFLEISIQDVEIITLASSDNLADLRITVCGDSSTLNDFVSAIWNEDPLLFSESIQNSELAVDSTEYYKSCALDNNSHSKQTEDSNAAVVLSPALGTFLLLALLN